MHWRGFSLLLLLKVQLMSTNLDFYSFLSLPILTNFCILRLQNCLLLITILNGYSNAQSLEFTPNQYHIQTDEGNSRFFKYQTWGGQYRKETRLDDGSVVGSYGWIDANGILRMYHYIADDDGYRITKDNSYNVEEKEFNNLVEPELREENPLVETIKQKEGRKLKFVKKTKAEFTLPKATFSTPSSRFQRRISPDFVPIFEAEPEEDNNLLTPKTIVKSLPRKVQKVSQLPRNPRIPRIQPRGEGYRTRYVRQQTNQIPLTRQSNRFKSRRPNNSAGGKFYVVKRRRRLPTNKFSNRRINIEDEDDFDYEQAKETVNFQTDKTFHHEGILDSGERIGEFGYIDPIGVRRVVQYATNSQDDQQNEGIFKTKENDFYGPNTYFEAN